MLPHGRLETLITSGANALSQGAYLEAHEHFEEAFHHTKGVSRQLAQVLAQWAAALLHAERENQIGARRTMEKALARLSALDEQGPSLLDTPALLEAMLSSWSTLRRGEAGAPPTWQPHFTAAHEVPLELTTRTVCPYCGERVEVSAERRDEKIVRYVEDCPVCCRPWEVVVTADEVQLHRHDA